MLLRLLVYLVTRPWHAAIAWRAAAHHGQGLRRERAGDAEGARRSLERALLLAPSRREWWATLGDIRFRAGDFAKAALCYRTAAEDKSAVPGVQLRLGRALLASGEGLEAIVALRAAYQESPSDETLRELVHALIQTDNVRKAKAVSERAVVEDPTSFAARLLLATVCQKAHEPIEALDHFDAALRLRPGDAEALDMRGVTLQQLGRMEDALADYDRALAIVPGFPPALFHRGLARLLLGDFERGWEGYEVRKLSEEDRRVATAHPIWDGARIPAKTLLVRREQGLGDEIMFASIYGDVVSRVGHCLIECDSRLRSLFERSIPQATFFPAMGGPLPKPLASRRVDFEIDAGSLPNLFRRGAASFPPHGGYLKAAPARVERWRQRLAELGGAPAIGISWTGGVRKTGRATRSLSLENCLPLLKLSGLRFVSLQYTPEAEEQVASVRRDHGVDVQHWPEAIDDYDETAALVCALDLVVSVCTSVVHLAGALGRPVWVLAPYSPEWRYGFRGSTMAWYPSVRIFRQTRFGDWSDALSEVRTALQERSRVPA
ncbi:MAG TPA: tetratricopeptide repeat-containing glycosyltransferase family protein [Burkholderiales bacterium]|nr:tetratricopeptide repeat-containing glycosyltransferase family protein [Burkholderiales bacterium]